jgi:nitrite reductase/ring-hydroxylating ferredoxin subunit
VLRITGAGRLEEGFARKARYRRSPAGPAEERVLWRVGGRLFALDSLCPHEGGRIAEGPLAEGRFAFCPLHLYKFDPRDGSSVELECPPARTFRVEEVGLDAEVWVGP